MGKLYYVYLAHLIRKYTLKLSFNFALIDSGQSYATFEVQVLLSYGPCKQA